jgi:hypothetical protein
MSDTKTAEATGKRTPFLEFTILKFEIQRSTEAAVIFVIGGRERVI